MTVCSRHNAEWLGFRKCAHARHRTRYAIGTAIIATLSYLTVLISCACPDGEHFGSSVVQNLAHASVTSETPGHDTDEELCKFVHEQVVTVQAFSIGPILGAKTPHTDIEIGEKVPRLTAMLNGFRPPGNSFAPAKELSFQLCSVLRI